MSRTKNKPKLPGTYNHTIKQFEELYRKEADNILLHLATNDSYICLIHASGEFYEDEYALNWSSHIQLLKQLTSEFLKENQGLKNFSFRKIELEERYTFLLVTPEGTKEISVEYLLELMNKLAFPMLHALTPTGDYPDLEDEGKPQEVRRTIFEMRRVLMNKGIHKVENLN